MLTRLFRPKPTGVAAAPQAPQTGFFGDYESWSAALRDCGPEAGHETQAVLDHYVWCYEVLENMRGTEHAAPDRFRRVRPVMEALHFARPVERVVDFGGSHGEYYQRLRHLDPAFDPVWDIVETPAVCSIADRLGASPRKRFFSSIDALPPGPVSLVIASGVLQTLQEPRAVLPQLFGLGAPYVLISRLPVAPLERDRLTVFRPSVMNAAFPAWFFGRSIIDEFTRYGEVLYDFTVPEDVVHLDDVPVTYSGVLVRAR
jgi:putative methyltransferase (TIGR04325 family)